MSKPFLIRHPETRAEFELADVAFFVREYQPKGFVIVDPAPMNYTVPDAEELSAVESKEVDATPDDPTSDLQGFTRAELNAKAEVLGIDNPDQYKTKAELIEVIAAFTPDDEGGTD